MRFSNRFAHGLLFVLAPLVVLASVWYPEVRHYRVAGIEIPNRSLEEARSHPPDKVLRELATYDAGLTPSRDNADQALLYAEGLMRGDVAVPGVSPTHVRFPFDPGDFGKGLPSAQLQFSGMIPMMLLLDAYRVSGREAFLTAARDWVVRFDEFEGRTWLPRGLLWNDHAVASRAYVLTYFWSLYRDRSAGDPEAARAVLRMAHRCGTLLSRAGHFTYATNHGVLQNLAIWNLELAFPALPGATGYRKLALERLTDQMAFYIGREGVVLEHSAGYHQLGVMLLGRALRYCALSGIPAPSGWEEKYREAIGFYNVLRRPDGSLPPYGDTHVLSNRVEPGFPAVAGDGRSPARSRPGGIEIPKPWTLKPVSGYAVLWGVCPDGSAGNCAEQAVSLWSNFQGHGHKHADEMSVTYWAGGRAWWTATGYWPYGVAGRKEAEGWQGSNAPHLAEETDARGQRSTALRYSAWSPDIAFLDMVRTTPGGYAVRRQLLRASPGLWAVIDVSYGADAKRTVRTWTAPHDVRISKEGSSGSFLIESPGIGEVVRAWVLGSEGVEYRPVRGSNEPFAGWEVYDGLPVPAPALEVSQSSDGSWTAFVWRFLEAGGKGNRATGTPVMRKWEGAEEWELELPLAHPIRIQRRADRLTARGLPGQPSPRTILLEPGLDVERQRRELRSALEDCAEKYPKFRDITTYRSRVSYGILGLFIVQGAVFLALRRKKQGMVRIWQYSCAAAWVFLGMWLHLHYFAV